MSIFELPVVGAITVRVTIIVSSHGAIVASNTVVLIALGAWQHLALTKTIFVPFPVKVPHIPHVQSIGEKMVRFNWQI